MLHKIGFHDANSIFARSERASVTSLHRNDSINVDGGQSMSLAERMIEQSGTAVTTEAAAHYSALHGGDQGSNPFGLNSRNCYGQ